MPRVIRFNSTFFHVVGGESLPQFIAGEYYAVDEETQRHVAMGIAEEIDAPDDADKAIPQAGKLQDKAADVAAAAHDAQVLAEAAQAAEAIAAQEAAAPATDSPPAA